MPFFQKAAPGGTPTALANGSPRKPQWNSNDFDANLGGPIQKDKTFLFASYLGVRRRQGIPTSAVVPNDSQRAAIDAHGTREARALLALIPPATTGNTLLSSPVHLLRRDQGLAKFDHTFSRANRFSATYLIEDGFASAPFSAHPVPGFGVTFARREQHIGLRDTHVFSPTLFHEFRASFRRVGSTDVVPLNRTTLSSLGLDGIVPDNPASEGPPFVLIAGFSAFGNSPNGPQLPKVNYFQFLDNVSWVRGRHHMKFGGEFRTFANNLTFDNIPNGVIFIDGSGTVGNRPLVPQLIPGLPPALNDFANGFAAFFAQNPSARVGHRSRAVNLFIQDDWKVRAGLSLNFGLRWEFNGPYTRIGDRVAALRVGQQSSIFPDAPVGLVYPGDPGVSRSTYSRDLNNFAPRFGFAWDVFGDGRLSVRGGYGLFYDAPFDGIILGSSLSAPPYTIRPTTLFTDYANPWEASRVNPIPQPFPRQPPRPGERVDFTRFAPVSFDFLDPNFRTPYGQQWNLQVQYQLANDWLLEAGYVGSNGVNLISRRQFNNAVAGPGANVGNTNQRRILNLGNPQNGEFGGAVFGRVGMQTNNANSNYNSLQVNLSRRMARGLYMSHAYTWSHTIDNASGGRVSSRLNPREDRGNSDTDVRHRYVLSFVYELPFHQEQTGALGRILGGWGFSGVTTFQSGLWSSVFEPSDRCLCDTPNQRVDSTGLAIQFLDPRSSSAVAGRPNSWFDGTGGGSPTAAPNPYFRRVGSGPSFALGAGRYGNVGRNTILMPGVNNWDLSVFKHIKMRESQTLEFRAEFFNAFNHTQFRFPDLNVASPNFGRVSRTEEPRIVQFGLRYSF